MSRVLLTRRSFLAGTALLGSGMAVRQLGAQSADEVTFLFISDVHACRMNTGLSPNCQQEGKTDQNLLRHITALNLIGRKRWPSQTR